MTRTDKTRQQTSCAHAQLLKLKKKNTLDWAKLILFYYLTNRREV